MIFRSRGYLTNETGDFMDSAMRAGVLTCFRGSPEPLQDYVVSGALQRSPIGDSRQTNSRNVGKDQLLPAMAGLAKLERYDINKKLFAGILRRGLFAQNSERDIPGSTKYPWPHRVTEDDGSLKWRIMDFADPLFWPHYLGFFFCTCGYRLLGHLVGAPFLLLMLLLPKTGEQNSLLCLCHGYGSWTLKFYKNRTPNWKILTQDYWNSRNESEYAKFIIEYICKLE